MEKIVKTFSSTVKNCYYIGGHCDLTVNINVYEKTHKFLWRKWKTYFTKEYVPYIPDPHYDGEYTTNDRLEMALIMLRSQVDIFVNECKNNK